jgi:hypothetical protein
VCPWIEKATNIFGWKFKVPFDPHDVKYFEGLNEKLLALPEHEWSGIRKGIKVEQDIKFIISPFDGSVIGERTAPIKLVYFSTHKTKKGCVHYEACNARS